MIGLGRYLALLLGVAAMVSCAKPVPSATPTLAPMQTATIDWVEPGDQVSGYLVIMGEPGKVTFQWDLDESIVPGPDNATIDVPLGTILNISSAIYDGTYSGKLDTVWAEATYELEIDGHPVAVSAFGSVDIPNPMVGTMRAWNVVVVADKVGQFTIHDQGVESGDPYENTTTYRVVPPASSGAG